MNIPNTLKYAKSHEWVREVEGGVEIGLSDFAQSELGDLVFVNLPQVGDAVEAGESFGDVESVKAVSDVFSPVSGVVSQINEALLTSPEKINEDAYAAWLIRVSDVTGTVALMDAAAYEAAIGEA